MKAVGKWVLVEIINEKHGVIVSKFDNKGIVAHCACDKELNGKLVYFNPKKEYTRVQDYVAVHYDDILAVE